jgi:uncharacterized protein YndB with AHSA1/START domain
METSNKTAITVETIVKAPIEKDRKYWNEPKHITQWCTATPEWHTPYSDNDVRVGGKFKSTMAAKDGSFSFDFEGVYTNVKENQVLEYTMPDGRKVKVLFSTEGGKVKVLETFDPEKENPVEMQKGGWQAILDNFKKYTESN